MPRPDPRRILRQHVQTDQLLGVEALPLPPGVFLRSAPAPPAAQAPRPSPERTTTPPKQTAYTRPDTHRAAAPPVRPAPAKPSVAATTPMFATRYPVQQGLTTEEKREKLDTLRDAFENDPAVQATRPTGTRLAWDDGSVDADIMFIGEGPGEVENQQGKPFVGPAGELLNKMIVAMGLDRPSVYIANVVKYRPPGNRVPTPEESAVSGPYLAQQVAIVAPKAIVALGGTATKFALQTTTGITRLRGQWGQFGFTDPPIPLMPTFHPAFLLRSYTTANRKKVWEDLQAVLKRVGG